MKKKIRTINKFFILFLFSLGLSVCNMLHAQCVWSFTTSTDSSLCLASGKIRVTLTGTDAANLTGVLYSIEETVVGGYSVAANTSSVFENVPAGTHRVKVQAVCNGVAESRYADVVVKGNYVPMTASILPQRSTLNCGNFGKATASVLGGKKPYVLQFTATPAAYTGTTSFSISKAGEVLSISNLAKGDYSARFIDSCGTATAIQTFTITELTALTTADFTTLPYNYAIFNSCNSFYLTYPFPVSARVSDYVDNDEFTYSAAYNTEPKLPYKSMRSYYLNYDTIVLPGTQTFKDYYSGTITMYLKPSCGTELTVQYKPMKPYISLGYTANCSVDFNALVTIQKMFPTCFPVYVTYKNNTSGIAYNSIVQGNINGGYVSAQYNHLPYGSYTVTARTSDNYLIDSISNWNVLPPATNPYYVQVNSYSGENGNDRAASISIIKNGSTIDQGATVELVNSPATYSSVVPIGTGSVFSIYWESVPPYKGIYPGQYTVKITDNCGVNYIPVTISETDVYSYTWGSIEQEQTCSGLKITPQASCKYLGLSKPVYYGIIEGPVGSTYSKAVVPAGTSLVLPVPGDYKIAIGSSGIYDFGIANHGNGVNTKTITYQPNPVIVDINRSLGWVCPGQPANQGNIRAFGLGGVATSGHYTFKLALQGQGATGPYLATNTTGAFSTASSGGAYTLTANQNYDIKIEDDCGASSVQTLKILDFATAQIASSDKPSYCPGEPIKFKVINLPSTAIDYNWSGPDNFFSKEQSPSFIATSRSAGLYHVAVNSDICGQPIENDIRIQLNNYSISCYSAVTDTAVNPYVAGLLGNWRNSTSYTYYDKRTEVDPAQQISIRKAGTFSSFSAFWNFTAGKLNAAQDTTKWVWNSKVTMFNTKGAEIENKDALGRYNSGLYGYNNTLPTAVIQNGTFRESAFEGFEDYDYSPGLCDTACQGGGRHIDFSNYRAFFTSQQSHTGKYSLLVTPGNPIGLVSGVEAADTTSDVGLSFTAGTNACFPSIGTLAAIKAGKSALLPLFKPVTSSKILLSAWVKEEAVCKTLTYTGNAIVVTVKLQDNSTQVTTVLPTGNIIEGWQRYEQVIALPANAVSFAFNLKATGSGNVFFDDIRIHPYSANMKSFVYDPVSLRLMAELDENNYASFYEYDDDGTLIRVKKETERGIQTIKETRSALLKEN